MAAVWVDAADLQRQVDLLATSEHDRLEELFSAALAKGTWAERAAFLDGACGDNVALRSRVEQLLTAHPRASSFLEMPAADPRATVGVSPPEDKGGEWIGRYRLLEIIGEGGFGTVHLAEQQEPVRRKVAIKVLDPEIATAVGAERFLREIRITAQLQHPHIVPLLESGEACKIVLRPNGAGA